MPRPPQKPIVVKKLNFWLKKCQVYQAKICANNNTSRKVHLPHDAEVGKTVLVVVK